ncbi:hypothetical protein ACQ4PT_042074 [Festuca glaucescens]
MSEAREVLQGMAAPVEGAEEGVNSMMGRLNLLADETEVVEMSDDEDDSGAAAELWALDGKVLSPHITHIQSVRAATKPAWGNPKGLRIRPPGDNVFVAVFATSADRDRVLEGTPWVVGWHAILLQPHDPRLRPSDVRFDSMTIWVRILNLPFEWMNNKKGLKIAKLIDKNCSVDVDEFGVASGTFLRAKVAIPFDQPLRRWVIIRRDGRDESFNLQYEKLPFFCFGCGLIGHDELECKNPADRDAPGKLPFDRNLRAPEERRIRMQSFEQAAASASWNSGSKDRGGGSQKSGPSSATSRTSADGDPLKPGEQIVNSPPAKAGVSTGKTMISKIARQLFPDSGSLVQLPLKRKPSDCSVGAGVSSPEGDLIEQIDKNSALVVVPVRSSCVTGAETCAAGFDTGQGNEKKLRSGQEQKTQRSVYVRNSSEKGGKSDAGLPIQPCSKQ